MASIRKTKTEGAVSEKAPGDVPKAVVTLIAGISLYDAALIAATLRQMQEFFSLPRNEKLAIERTADNAWGFFDRELTKNVRDWKEIFDF